MRHRIGIFDASRSVSGISRYVRALLGGIDRAAFDVTVFSPCADLYADLAKVIELHADGHGDPAIVPDADIAARSTSLARSSWKRLAPPHVRHLAGYGRQTMRLADVFRRHPVDLMHVQIVGAEEAAAAARLAGVRKVLGTLHIDSSQSSGKRWMTEAITNHVLDLAIAVSRATARDWVRRTRLPGSAVTTIVNGVDVEHFQPAKTARDKSLARRALGIADRGQPVIATVGRLSVQKGISFLLDALAQFAHHLQLRYVELLIAGDGPLRETLAGQAAALGIASRVRFVGMQSDVRTALHAADAFALPSLWEAMPYALLEAMACGLPSIASAVAGVPEVIGNNVNGLLVEPRDVFQLSAAIQTLFTSADTRIAMGRAARGRIVECFDEREMIARTVSVYRSMLHAPRRFGASRSRRTSSHRLGICKSH